MRYKLQVKWLLFFFIISAAAAYPAQAWAGTATVYFYQDQNGTYHFTDIPTSENFRVYMIYPKSMPDLDGISSIIRAHGTRHSIDPELIRAMIEVESAFNPGAISRAGAQGLMQIMPQTQKDLGLYDPFDPDSNIEAGTRYLKQLLERFGSLPLALAAYNAGPSKVEQYNGIPPYKETREYITKVMEIYSNNKRSR